MKPTKLKTSKETNYNTVFLEYISNLYGPQAITKNLQDFFFDFNENRKVISHKKDDIRKVEDLNTTLNITTKYLNQLVAIKGKTVISSQKGCCDLEFMWTDTITGNAFTSKNINFEYYNILFNIASLYFHLGYQKSFSPNINKAGRKEAVNCYKNSMYLFNLIRDEAVNKIDAAELPYDLSPSYCEYCSTLCIIYGQIEIVKIAEETSPKEFALRGKLLMGISENYYKAYQLSNSEPSKRGGTSEFRNYLINRCNYYKSLVLKKHAEIFSKKFDDTGLGYGEATVYQELSVNCLIECQKTINSMGRLVDVDNFNELFNKEKKLCDKMKDLNNRIYHQYTPDPKTITLESKIMMVPLAIENLYIKDKKDKVREDKTIYCEDLYLLIPNEIKPMLQDYKIKMSNFIKDYLSKYENETTIHNFINGLHLSSKFIVNPNEKNKDKNFEFSSTWEKLSEIQQCGGAVFLSKSMKNILNKSAELEKNLNLLLQEIKNEENEDDYYRKKIGIQYVLTPSKELNSNFIQTAKNYLNQILKSREYDIQKQNEINEASKYYQDLIISKAQFIKNIEIIRQTKEPMNDEEIQIRQEILKLYDIENKLISITDPIFKEINSGSGVIHFFAEVLVNKMTERSIFDITKEKYLKQLEPISGINNEIKNQINVIRQLMSKLSDNITFPRANENPVAKYISSIENNCDSFNKNKEKLKKAENYYIELENNIEKLIRSVRGWIGQRKEEKKMCLGTVKGNIKPYNPYEVKNPFENKNISKSDYYSSNPQVINQINNNIQQNNYNTPNQNQNENDLDQPYCSATTGQDNNNK